MKKYTVELTEGQLSTISVACEILARLGIGQWKDAFDHLPLVKDNKWEDYWSDMDAIGMIISKYTERGGSSAGITSNDTSNSSKIAWDLYQSFRQVVSWEYAIKQGWVESRESSRNWDEMLGVSYDDPLKTSTEPLAKIMKQDEV